MDHAGAIEGGMLLFIGDAHSKWLDVHVVSSTTSKATIDKLSITMAMHGAPRSIVTDNGTCLTGQELQDFVKSSGIQHVTSAPYHPSCLWKLNTTSP